MSSVQTPIFRWPSIVKDPDATFPASLSVFGLCASFWRPNEPYDLGDFAWPNIRIDNGQITKGAIGYVFECTAAGRSASKEPRWNLVADQVLAQLDGSVQWTARIGLAQGLQPAQSATVTAITPNDGAFTTSEIIVDENTKLLVDYSGGVLGTDYTVEFEFMIGGRPQVGRQIVQVRQI